MEATNREFEDLFPEKKRVKNPFVPIGMDISFITLSNS